VERAFSQAIGDGGALQSTNLKLSQALLDFLLSHNVKTVVACSGSRNSPLIFTLQSHESFQIFHHHDERSAAFFALGLSMKEKNPVAVLCTSGTAVAEMLPATIEAYYQNLPLILVSADRPHAYRGTGAPQAIEQVGIFSQYARCVDIQSESDFPTEFSTPLHLNICLEEPKAGDWPVGHLDLQGPSSPAISGLGHRDQNGSSPLPELEEFLDSSRVLVVVGSLSVEDAKHVAPFLEKLQAPVLADSTANLEVAPYILRCGERLLRTWKPEKVLRLGSVPSFRFWRDLENLSIEILSLSTQGFSGLARACQNEKVDSFEFLSKLSPEVKQSQYEEVFELDHQLSERLEVLLKRYPHSELALIRKLSEFISPDALLYLGNSLPIREWNLVNGQHRPTYANRGANGIDGQVSTYLGLADSSPESWALVGDQTALYDLNALALSNQSSAKQFKSKRRIVVMNNGGGKIFSHLSYSQHMEHSQRKLLENHHRWEFRAWADMFAWAYESWQVDSCLLNSQIDDLILEIFPDAAQTHHFWAEWRAG